MLNNLSAELNILRPSMLETGLEAIAHNLNRKNNDLRFFEFGKTYATDRFRTQIQRTRTSLFIHHRKKSGRELEAINQLLLIFMF